VSGKEGRNDLTFIHLDVHGTPPDIVFAGLLVDDSFVLGTATSFLAREIDKGTRRGNDGTLVSDSIFVKQGWRCIALDLDAIHVEASLGEVLEFTTDHW